MAEKEYIEREAVSTMLHRLRCEFANAGNSDGARACILADINLSTIPAADVRPVARSEWEQQADEEGKSNDR